MSSPSHLYHIGKMIRTIREHRGISQGELADKAGITRTRINQIETGEVNFTIDSLVAISSALNCYLDVKLTPVK